MPLFEIGKEVLSSVEQTNFSAEKVLQTLIERNLGVLFNCRFVASEFPTGTQHAGRIDTLGLSEDENPVIIEYKRVESSELITQSLFYLSWIHDHRGDFEIAAQKSLGNSVAVDWSDVRVICIAPNYKDGRNALSLSPVLCSAASPAGPREGENIAGIGGEASRVAGNATLLGRPDPAGVCEPPSGAEGAG